MKADLSGTQDLKSNIKNSGNRSSFRINGAETSPSTDSENNDGAKAASC